MEAEKSKMRLIITDDDLEELVEAVQLLAADESVSGKVLQAKPENVGPVRADDAAGPVIRVSLKLADRMGRLAWHAGGRARLRYFQEG